MPSEGSPIPAKRADGDAEVASEPHAGEARDEFESRSLRVERAPAPAASTVPAGERLPVTGVVLGAEGAPASGGTVRWFPHRGGPGASVSLRSDGTFSIALPRAEPGVLRAELEAGGVARRSLLLRAEEEAPRLRLRATPRTQVTGRLVDLLGRGIPRLQVEVPGLRWLPGHRRFPGAVRTVTDDSGAFRFDDLPRGPLAFTAGTPSGVRFELGAYEETAHLDLPRLQLPLVELRVRAVRASGPPLELSRRSNRVVPWGRSVVHCESEGRAGRVLPPPLPGAAPEPLETVVFHVEPGHVYRITLVGLDHDGVAHLESIPPGRTDREVILTAPDLGPFCEVELVREDPERAATGESTWTLTRHFPELRSRVSSSLVGLGPRLLLLPGKYELEAMTPVAGDGAGRSVWSGVELEVRPGAGLRVPVRVDADGLPIPPGLTCVF